MDDNPQGPYMYYNSQTGMPIRDFRPRRPHNKSKNGCKQCKHRRIKCDELRPRCTRCSKGQLLCKYPDSTISPSERSRNFQLGHGAGASTSLSDPATQRFPGGSWAAPTLGPDPESNYFTNPLDQMALSTCNHPSRAPCPITSMAPPPGYFAEHAELFDHFSRHTSQAINFDEEDFYACQVGIPNLVKDCPALAATVLSLAATCSCVDILSHPAPIPGDRERVKSLLAQADRHHLLSVQAMQRVIAAGGPAPHEHYDHVLANAWMMAAYSTSSHRLRIWLYKSKQPGEILDHGFLPNQSGWITMFRTVHSVYMSILGSGSQPQTAQAAHSPQLPLDDVLPGTGSAQNLWPGPDGLSSDTAAPTLPTRLLSNGAVPFSEEIIAPNKYPVHISQHVLFSMLVSTSPQALRTLQYHAQRVAHALASNPTVPGHQESLTSCLSAIEIPSDLITQVRNTASPTTSTQATSEEEQAEERAGFFHFDFTPSAGRGRFSEISPWLRNYLSRALAVNPSRPLRRLVMAFLYRVPGLYLDTVKRMLDSFPLDAEAHAASESFSLATSSSSAENHLLFVSDDEDGGSSDCSVNPASRWTTEAVRGCLEGCEFRVVGTSSGESIHHHDSVSTAVTGTVPQTAQRQPQEMLDVLAMDIFAHWLGFTLLLDGVWSFGEIGMWELDRIVRMVRSGRLRSGRLKMGCYVPGLVGMSAGGLQEKDDDGSNEHHGPEGLETWWPGRVRDFAEGMKRTPRQWQ